MARLSAERGDIVDDDAGPECLAGGDKSRVVRTLGLVILVVLKRFEVQGGREVERMIGNRAVFGLGGGADIAALKVTDLCKATNLTVEGGAFRRREVFVEPEDGAVNEHRFFILGLGEGGRTRSHLKISVKKLRLFFFQTC
jgi:hypothetical protein